MIGYNHFLLEISGQWTKITVLYYRLKHLLIIKFNKQTKRRQEETVRGEGYVYGIDVIVSPNT